jgi:ATP-binding cassette, subfamily C, bacterial CydD
LNLNSRLIKLVRSSIWSFVLTVLLNITGGVFIIFWAFTLAQIINHVFLDGWTLFQVFPLLLWLLGFILMRAILLALGEISSARLAVNIKTVIRHDLMAKITRLGPNYIKGESSGALAAAALQGVELLDSYFSQYLPQLILAAFLPLLILCTIFPMDWLTGVVLIVTAPLIPIFMILIGKASEALTKKQFGDLRRMSAFFLDNLQGLTTLKLLNQSHNQTGKIARVGENYRHATMGVLRLTFLSALALEWLATLSVAVVAVEIGIRLLSGNLVFGQAFFILIIAPEFYLPLRMVGLRFHASATGVAAAKSIFQVMDEPLQNFPVSKNSINPPQINIQAPFHICFNEVSYSYPGRDSSALQNVSFIIGVDQQIALVGKSGAGKSTVASLLLGLVFPSAGNILINEINLADIPMDLWRLNLSWVPQRPFLYNMSLYENIILGKRNATTDEVWNAIRQASLENVVKRLPGGWDAKVGEKGTKLSGGQAQRVALARAFLRNSPVVIMDEPTAHLDPEQEGLLIDATHRLCKGRTVLTIAHRLATVIDADQIIVLDNGAVVETGNHAGLLKNDGPYAKLVSAYLGEVI